jgi:hypothetical protein
VPTDWPHGEHLGDVVAHHAGPKTNDSTTVPLCFGHHDAWHSANGAFKGMDKEQRRKWAEFAIAETRLLVAMLAVRAETQDETRGEP